jgi:GntR family transcriptional regulator/MocR family aminotransferase
MSEPRRAELLDWARRSDGLIVEDDYDAEFNLGTAQVGALQPRDPARIIYLGTSSKILSPALRLGWIVAPARLSEELASTRPGFDLGVSVIEQLAMVYLMSTGKLDRHLRRTRRTYDRRRSLVISALHAAVPDARISGAGAGPHLIASLPHDVSESRVVAEAARRSVGVFGLGHYRIGRPSRCSGSLVSGLREPERHRYHLRRRTHRRIHPRRTSPGPSARRSRPLTGLRIVYATGESS